MADALQFDPKAVALVEERKRSYQLALGNPMAKVMLADLAQFCRANESTWHDDPAKRDMLAGRREVWLRITEHFNLETDDLLRRYGAVMTIKEPK